MQTVIIIAAGITVIGWMLWVGYELFTAPIMPDDYDLPPYDGLGKDPDVAQSVMPWERKDQAHNDN